MRTARRTRRPSWLVDSTDRNGVREERWVVSEDPVACRTWMEKKGYTVHGIVRRPKGGRPKPPGGWKISALALREAQVALELQFPVKIEILPHQGGKRGDYQPSDDGKSHRIRIKNWLDTEQASKTLWHELTHAKQTEREIQFGERTLRPAFSRMKTNYEPLPGRKKGRYKHSPCEIEANNVAEMMYADMPLVRPV
jgi:hypothetical protein